MYLNMAAILEQLDPELISLICAYLDVTSLSSLRLSSKSCKAKFTPEFLRYFETQNIDLTAHGLQRLCDLASSPGLSPGVRTLNLMCLYYHQQPSSEEVSRKTIIELTSPGRLYRRRENYHEPPVLGREQEEAWMAEKLADQAAFSGASMCHQLCQALSNFRTLDMIALEAAVICGLKQRRGPEEVKHLHWRKLWAQAIQAFRVVISAIACSQISLRSLIIYSRTKKCSIPTSEFTGQLLAKLQEEGFAKVGHSIGSFSISLATPVIPFRPATDQTTSSLEFYEPFDISCGQRLDASNPQVDPHANISGVARLLLYLTPKLESLNIHLYNTTTCTSSIPEERPYQDFLSSLFQNLSAPRLKSLTLHGMPVTMETMVDIFSQNRGLQFLSLENIFLTSGSWDRVLAEATQTCTSLSVTVT